MKIKNKDMVELTELIRRVSHLLSPDTYLDDIYGIMNKQVRDRLFGQYPQCYLMARNIWGRELPILPICNRQGIENPQMISFSLKVANLMKDSPYINQDHLGSVLVKLTKLHSKFSKDIPKPVDMAQKKAMTTRLFTKIKNYLNFNKNNKE